MNRIKDLIIQFCKFGAVGGLCFGIDYGLMIFLTETHIMHYFASSAVSFTVSVIVNYILSMRFVFTGKEDMTKAQEMVIFVALSMIGLVMNQMIMWFAVEHLGMFYAVDCRNSRRQLRVLQKQLWILSAKIIRWLLHTAMDRRLA